MAGFNTGDIVTLVSGSPRMTVEKMEGRNVLCVWINEGIVHRDMFDAAIVKAFEGSSDRGGFGGGDRGGRPSYGDKKPYGDKPSYGDKKPYGDKPSYGDKKPYSDKKYGEKKTYGDKKPSSRDEPTKDKKFFRKD